MLADVVSLKKNIIVTGTHGKTTTTSLIAKILSAAIRPNNYQWWSYKFD